MRINLFSLSYVTLHWISLGFGLPFRQNKQLENVTLGSWEIMMGIFQCFLIFYRANDWLLKWENNCLVNQEWRNEYNHWMQSLLLNLIMGFLLIMESFDIVVFLRYIRCISAAWIVMKEHQTLTVVNSKYKKLRLTRLNHSCIKTVCVREPEYTERKMAMWD